MTTEHVQMTEVHVQHAGEANETTAERPVCRSCWHEGTSGNPRRASWPCPTVVAEAERDQAQSAADEAWALYKDLQQKSEQWLAQANERARRSDQVSSESLMKLSTAGAELGAYRQQRDEVLTALADLLAAVYVVTNADPTHYEVANAVGGPALVARGLVDRYRRATSRCAHGHAGCCGHHDPEDMPLPPHGCHSVAGTSAAPTSWSTSEPASEAAKLADEATEEVEAE